MALTSFWSIVLISICLLLINKQSAPPILDKFILPFWAVLFFLVVINVVLLHKRRFNDFNYSGWWILTTFIPLLAIIPFLFLIFKRGTQGENRFGAPAKKSTKLEWALAALYPLMFFLLLAVSIGSSIFRSGAGV